MAKCVDLQQSPIALASAFLSTGAGLAWVLGGRTVLGAAVGLACAAAALTYARVARTVPVLTLPSTVFSASSQARPNASPTVAEQHAFLDLAKKYDWAGVKQALAGHPSLVNVQPGGRWSALHQAARCGSTDAVEMLLASGANPRSENREGKTPREVASKAEVLQVLKSVEGALACSRLREIKLAATQDTEEQKLGAVILTVSGARSSSYDNMFTTTPQQGPNGTRVAVYQATFADLAYICAHLRASASGDNLNTGGAADEIYRQLARDVHAVTVSSFCLNLECCGCCSDKGFVGLSTAAEKHGLWDTIDFVIARGSFTMASDFSLKALIKDWRPHVLGPNPFVQIQHGAGCGFAGGAGGGGGGGCNRSFKLEFDPPTLSACPSAQLATVGELCVYGEANVSAMSGTIVYSLNKDAASEVQVGPRAN